MAEAGAGCMRSRAIAPVRARAGTTGWATSSARTGAPCRRRSRRSMGSGIGWRNWAWAGGDRYGFGAWGAGDEIGQERIGVRAEAQRRGVPSCTSAGGHLIAMAGSQKCCPDKALRALCASASLREPKLAHLARRRAWRSSAALCHRDFRPRPHGAARAGKPRMVPMFALAMADGVGGPGMKKRDHGSIGTDQVLHCKNRVEFARRRGGAEVLCGPRPEVHSGDAEGMVHWEGRSAARSYQPRPLRASAPLRLCANP